MEFKELQILMEKQFIKISKHVNFLYTLNLEKNTLWDIYLESFPSGSNEIFRERREHDCSGCRQFINNFGDTIAIIDNKIVSIWDFEITDERYAPVIKVLSDFIKTKTVQDIYVSRFKQIGTKQNREKAEDGTIITWNHFNVTLDNKFIGRDSDSIATYKAKYRDIKNVFKRSLEEISETSVLTVLELIAQNSLYKGAEWKTILTKFNKYQKEYKKLKVAERDNYLWDKSTTIGMSIGKIRNHSIGTLLINIDKGEELDTAVKKYESIVAPTNYKRPKPIFTKAMLDKAKVKLEELGFMDSLQRRRAILEDISVNNVLYSNKDVVKKLQDIDVFEQMKQEVPLNPKAFGRAEEVTMKEFVENILPTAKNIEVFVEGKHMLNMVSLIAPSKSDSKTMFKWDNNFSWAYTGNITDSDMKKNVKNAGGKVDGVLRFSIQWNELSTHNRDDYDAHCREPNGNKIYYNNKTNRATSGRLDVDITNPRKNIPAVENITWTDISKMEKGTYIFSVHDYTNRGGSDGFRAEIEFNGQIYNFDYPKALIQSRHVQVAEVTFDGTNFTIKEILKAGMSSREIWNIQTNNFVPVSIMMYSPNFWNEQKGDGRNENSSSENDLKNHSSGNQHYFFMLKGCVSDETPNGFFNEYLNNELTEHRKVFEVLGSKMKVDDVDNQLSGIGFSSTQKNSVIVRIEGQTKRVLKVKI